MFIFLYCQCQCCDCCFCKIKTLFRLMLVELLLLLFLMTTMAHSFWAGMHFACFILWFIAYRDIFTFYYGSEFHSPNLLHFAVQDGCVAIVVYLLTIMTTMLFVAFLLRNKHSFSEIQTQFRKYESVWNDWEFVAIRLG